MVSRNAHPAAFGVLSNGTSLQSLPTPSWTSGTVQDELGQFTAIMQNDATSWSTRGCPARLAADRPRRRAD